MSRVNGQATSLRDRLLNRERPTATYRLRVADDAEQQREWALAQDGLRVAQLRADADAAREQAKARRQLDKAQAALEACYEEIRVRALEPVVFEALVEQHPARKDTEDEAWNGDTFPRALFLACVEGDLTPEEWSGFLDRACSHAERSELMFLALAVNSRSPAGVIPKD
jgi:hypothetical protein